MKNIFLSFLMLIIVSGNAYAVNVYFIQAASQDRTFIIDGKIYEAYTVCFNMQRGDKVIFIEGNPNYCTSAKLYNLRSEDPCDVWCKSW